MALDYMSGGVTTRRETDEERRRREQGQPIATGEPPDSSTFAEMQRAGQARPAPMTYMPGGVGRRYGPNSSDPNPSGPPGQSPFGQSLLGQYQSYQGPSGFRSRTGVQSAPQYSSGARSPMLRTQRGFNPSQPRYSSQLEQRIAQALGNPSAYGQEAVRSTFDRLSGQIDDDFAQQTTGLEEDMARRGLTDSSIRGGRLADLNVGKRSARTELADRLTERMAETQAADTSRAIAQAMGYGSQTFNQGLAGYQADMGANAQNFDQDLASNAFGRQLGLDEFGAEMDSSRFASGEDQRGIDNAESEYGMNIGADNQGFNQRQSLLNSLLGYEQQGFSNRMTTQGFDADNAFRDRALDTQFLGSLLNTGMPGETGGNTGGGAIQQQQAQVRALQQMIQSGIPYEEAYRRVYGGQR